MADADLRLGSTRHPVSFADRKPRVPEPFLSDRWRPNGGHKLSFYVTLGVGGVGAVGSQFWATCVPKTGTLRKVAIRIAEYCSLV